MVEEKTYGFTAANLEYVSLIYSNMQSDWWVDHISNDDELRVTSRMISNLIHDIKGLRSGYVSVKALNAVINDEIKIGQLTNEHYHSRQTSGQSIVQYFLDHQDCTFEEFAMYLQRLCSVHKVLKAENMELRKYQAETSNWIEAYEQAGIELVKIGVERGDRWTRKVFEQHANDLPTPLQQVADNLAELYG